MYLKAADQGLELAKDERKYVQEIAKAADPSLTLFDAYSNQAEMLENMVERFKSDPKQKLGDIRKMETIGYSLIVFGLSLAANAESIQKRTDDMTRAQSEKLESDMSAFAFEEFHGFNMRQILILVADIEERREGGLDKYFDKRIKDFLSW